MHNQVINLACLRLDLGGLSNFARQLKDWFYFEGRYARRVYSPDAPFVIELDRVSFTCESAWMHSMLMEPVFTVGDVPSLTTSNEVATTKPRMVMSW